MISLEDWDCYFCRMHLIDTHCHLYAKEFQSDRAAVLKNAFDKKLSRIYLPNIDLDSVPLMQSLQSDYPENCFMMMGLHPGSVDAQVEEVLQKVKAYLDDGSEYFAVGEIGMDLYWDKSFKSQQEYAFREQIKWAKERALPIVIHCREAFDEIFEILDEVNDDQLFGIFHCFTGNSEQAQHILNYGGFKLGIGGVLTFKNSGLDKTISQIDLEHLVLETDAPYLAPTPHRGKRNEPAYLMKVAEKLSEIKSVDLEKVAEITSANAQLIFKRKYSAIER